MTMVHSSTSDDPASSLALLTSTLTNSPHEFLQSTPTLHAASLVVAKQYLDPLAASISSSRSRKRNNGAVLDKVYLDGFDVQQVWEQVRILLGEVEGSLGISRALIEDTAKDVIIPSAAGKKRKAIQLEPSDVDMGLEEQQDKDKEEDELQSEGDEDASGLSSGEGDEDELDKEIQDGEDDIDLKLSDDDLEGLEEMEDDGDEDNDEDGGVFVQDVHGLNDGFFSIDEFNRQTEMFEQIDQNGGEGLTDTEEEIDYNANPNELSLFGSRKQNDEDDFEEENEDEGDGFDEDVGAENANDIMYEDFFAPPPKKGLSESERKKQSWKNTFAKKSQDEVERELAEIESEMERVNHDLFEDAISQESGDEGTSPGDPASRKSTYEKRQAALTEEIRKLEIANVSKKQWTLSGEARASQRPLNSLLEEDLDFERIGKPVPVITQEVTEGLEDMIKRRILAGEFDELQKRRPEELPSNFRRGRIDLDDSKPQESLAEIYEREHLQSVDPANNSNKQDEKMAKEEEEIALLFQDIVKKLDSLSSWHFTPKPPKPSITVVSDAPAISMEEAQPTVSGGGAEAAAASMLAPQEVYNPIKDPKERPHIPGSIKEVVGKSGAPISVAEMTTEEKRKRRKQKKEAERKKNAAEGKTHGGKAKEGSKKDVVDTLKRGGVKIIGKGGEKRDVEGKLVKEKKGFASSNALKL